MAGLTLTALDLAEQRQTFVSAPTTRGEPEKPVEPPAASSAEQVPAISIDVPGTPEVAESPVVTDPVVLAEPPAALAEPPVLRAEAPMAPPEPAAFLGETPVGLTPEPVPASVPEAMLRVQKCASCGFPVSEGRT